MPDYLLVSDTEGLDGFVAMARRRGMVALDTEFVWERTFFPRLGLIQAAFSADECVLIDAPVVGDLSALGELLSDPAVVKVFHDASADLTAFRNHCCVSPRGLFDTHHAAGFAGLGAHASLARLVEAFTGVVLSKSESRTNWLMRPLTPKQVAYALDDVRYLPRVFDALHTQLLGRGTLDWYHQDLALFERDGWGLGEDPRERFRKVRGASRLSGQELSILRELAAWRECSAMDLDWPRGWVVSDHALVRVAQRRPAVADELVAAGVPAGICAEHGADILACVKKGLAVPRSDHPLRGHHGLKRTFVRRRADRILAAARRSAREAGVDPTLVATRAEATAMVASLVGRGPEPERFGVRWRRELLSDTLARLSRELTGSRIALPGEEQ